MKIHFYAILILFLVFNACSKQKIYSSENIKALPYTSFIDSIQKADDFIIIDVRTALEYKQGHYPNALNLSILNKFRKEITQLDTSKTVYVYCETAHRSPFAIKMLKKQGFTKIYELEKGYSQIRLNAQKK